MKYKEDFVKETVSLYKKQLDAIRAFRLTENEPGITHKHIVSYSTYSPWEDDKEFMIAYEQVKNNTLVDIYRCYDLWNYIKRNTHLNGDIVEVGVWRGGTGALMAKSASIYSNCKVYLADTFTGVVKATKKDTEYKGGEHFDTSLDTVESLLKTLSVSNTEILQGIFPDEVNLDTRTKESGDKIKLCHIDVDTYLSAKDIFYYVWPMIEIGGAVMFDDYGFWGCEGITKLCNEIHLDDAAFIHNINGHATFVKTR